MLHLDAYCTTTWKDYGTINCKARISTKMVVVIVQALKFSLSDMFLCYHPFS